MKNILILILLLSLTACPRGEFETIDDLLTIAKNRYQTTAAVSTPQKSQITELTNKLDSFTTATDAASIASKMESLVNHAGYTTRPAMNELISQYRQIAKTKKPALNVRELIISRTYNMLASELEGTAFRLNN